MKRLNILNKGITVQSSKCSLTLITAAQRRSGDQLDHNFHRTGSWSVLIIDLQAIYLFNMLAIWCNLCAIFDAICVLLDPRGDQMTQSWKYQTVRDTYGPQMSPGKSQQPTGRKTDSERDGERQEKASGSVQMDVCMDMDTEQPLKLPRIPLALNVWQLLWHFPEFAVLTSLKKAKWPWSEVSLSLFCTQLFSLSSALTLQ